MGRLPSDSAVAIRQITRRGQWLLPCLLAWASCGGPSPDPVVSSHAPTSAPTAVSAKADGEFRAEAESDNTATLPGAQHQLTVQPTASSDSSLTHQPQATAVSAPPAGAKATQATTDEPSSAERTKTDQAHQEARQQWYAAMREAPEAGLRLQALERWAQHPNDALDPLSYALVDEDESVRARAQELYAQQLARDAAEVVPVQQEAPMPAGDR